jgi:SAM-dependent methyltransferase
VHRPWQLKAVIQFVLAHAPGGEAANNVLQRWNGSYSEAARRSRVLGLAQFLSSQLDLNSKAIVEVGTGWDAVNTLMLYLFGAHRIYTYDHVRHLRFDLAMSVVRQIHECLPEIAKVTGIDETVLQRRVEKLDSARDLDSLLSQAGITYVAPGDAARSGLPDGSVDIFYSYAVLEHVSEEVIASLTSEARRVLAPNGIAFHSIGEHDHYTSFDSAISRVNFLKYPEWFWKFLVKNKIGYHNRLREPEFVRIFAAQGATVKHKESYTDPNDLKAVREMRIDSRFGGFTPEELAVTQTTISLSFPHPNEADRSESGEAAP